jgi:hypothetical protein
VAKLTGGRLISNINKQAPMLGALLQSMIDAHNHVASQAGIDPVGQSSAPPTPNAVTATVIGEQLHLRVTDNHPTTRAKTFFSEVHTDPNFTTPKIVLQHGSTRDSQVNLPTLNSAGTMQDYYVRSYSQIPGSPPSSPIAYPTYITMDHTGTTQGDLPPSSGSGTAPASGAVSGQGFGVFSTRKSTTQVRSV